MPMITTKTTTMRHLAALIVTLASILALSSAEALPPVSAWSASVDTSETHSAGTAAQISPDGTVLYVTTDKGRLKAYDASDGVELWDYRGTWGYSGSASGVVFSEDGTTLAYAASSDDGKKR